MKLYGKLGSCALALAVAGIACGSPPPPEPPKPKPPAAKPKPEPPPPPKCESIDEGCEASADTTVKIALAEHVFTPPEGWVYGQGAAATVAEIDDKGPVLVLSSFTPETQKTALADQRKKALAKLAELVSIELPEKKIDFDRPDEKAEVAGLSMRYWQLEKAKRGDRGGSLLVLLADLDDERRLLGLGYVPDDDSTEADRAIFEALESIKMGDDSNGGGEADEAPDPQSGAKESGT